MNPPKCDDLDYIHFLIASKKFLPAPKRQGVSLKEKKPLPTMPSLNCFQESLRGLAEGAFDHG
jgi:hypothetical protein